VKVRRTPILAALPLSLALSVVLPAALSAATPAAVGRTATSATATGRAATRFAPIYMTSAGLTDSEAQHVAAASDIVAGTGKQLIGKVPMMHRVNPSLSVEVYVNAMYSPRSERYPESDYAHTAKGARIIDSIFDIYLMNPSSAHWRSHAAAACRAALSRSGADACFLDNLGMAALSPGYVSGVPVDPATRRVYTPAAWLHLTGSIASSVAAQTPAWMMISNGIGSGGKYFDGPTRQLAAVSPAAMAEVFLRGPSSSLGTFPKVPQWKMNVDMLVDATARHYRILAVTKIWRKATSAQLAQWHKYALATYLLGAGPVSAFCFSPTQTLTGLGYGDAWAAHSIGIPVAGYSGVGAAYQRRFTGGLALVNPTSRPLVVPLPSGRFTDVDAKTYTTTIRLPAHSGAVLHVG